MDQTNTNDDANLKRFVQTAQRKLESSAEWPFNVQREVTASVTNATTLVGLPSDFVEIVQVYYEDGSVSPKVRDKLDEWQQPLPRALWLAVFGTDPTATSNRNLPLHYVIEYNSGTPQMILIPLPDRALTLYIKYRARLATLTADADTNYFTNSYPDLLVDFAMIEGLIYLRDFNQIPLFVNIARENLQNVKRQVMVPSSGQVRMALDPNRYAFPYPERLGRVDRIP